MNNFCLKFKLKSLIESRLKEHINNNYIYLDLPFHDNSGDALIWQGTLDYLSNLKYKNLGSYSVETFTFPDLDKSTIILLHGGGNFGDLYGYFHNFKMKVIENYPKNKIIFLPQTIFYQNDDNFNKDMELLNSHENLVFCARDIVSYSMLNKFKNTNIALELLPDMAFCINENLLVGKTSNRKLYMKRIDKELNTKFLNLTKEDDFDLIADWPTYSQPATFIMKKMKFLLKLLDHSKREKKYLTPYIIQYTNWYGNNIFRKHIVKQAIDFINSYGTIETTRLHGGILSVLLGKKVILLDNSYGKNSNFYNSWLLDYDDIELKGEVDYVN